MKRSGSRVDALRRVAARAACLALALSAGTSAWGGVGGAAGPTWPATLTVGNPVSAFIDIVNASDGVNASENVDILQITFTPSCAAQALGQCTTPDLGVFALGATAFGDPSSACRNRTFTFTGPSAPGVFTLSPSAAVRLGPADGSGGANNPRNCRIVINATVAKVPVDSTPPNPPATTFQFARVTLRGQTSGATGAANGQATIAIGAAADLTIVKTNGTASVGASAQTIYTVTVTNHGPSPAGGAIVKDPAVAGLAKTFAACAGTTGGAACPAATSVALLEGAGVTIPTLPSGATVTFAITATVTAASGMVNNSASVAPPPGTVNSGASCSVQPEPNARGFAGGICTAGDRDDVLPTVDLSVVLSNGMAVINSSAAAP